MQRFQIKKQLWRKRSVSAADISDELPLYNPASAIGRREIQSWSSRSVAKYNRIHLIPLVVMLCFLILWCFSSPVDLETKDGRVIFVPRAKKPPPETEATDLDLTVLALENPPDAFLFLSDEPYASLPVRIKPNDSYLDSDHDPNPSLADSPKNASFIVSREPKAPFSVSHEPIASFKDSHEANALFFESHEPHAVFNEVKSLFLVSNEPRMSYPDTTNEAAPQPSGKG